MASDQVDQEGYRLNVGIVLLNLADQVLWCQRYEPADSWQFPQGGVHQGETAEQAMFRELQEEVGITRDQVRVLAETQSWLRYQLPTQRQFRGQPLVGQKQKWFLLRLCSDAVVIRLGGGVHAEFVNWRWVDYWYPNNHIVAFKRDVYQSVLNEFAAVIAAE